MLLYYNELNILLVLIAEYTWEGQDLEDGMDHVHHFKGDIQTFEVFKTSYFSC